MAEDILKDLDEKISSLNSGMLLKKVMTLLRCPSIKGRQYYCSEGEDVMQHSILPHGVTELGGMKSFDNLAKDEDVFSSFEDTLEAASWMNWWFDATKTLVMRDTKERAKVHRLFIAVPGLG